MHHLATFNKHSSVSNMGSSSPLQEDIYPFLEGEFVETPIIHSKVELFHHRYLLYDLLVEVIYIKVHFFGLKEHL